MTNRELYLHVSAICQGTTHSLEDYLLALYTLTKDCPEDSIPIGNFAAFLEQAFVIEPLPFDEQWFEISVLTLNSWHELLAFQIADLRRMRVAGLLDGMNTYFGIDSSSGVRWYNLEPLTYLECAVRGTFGGYEADEVIILVSSPDGDNSEVFAIESISEHDFFNFLQCGATYE